ncbi:MAG: N-6 DNA methylase [Pseudomonadota bacterium]
MDKQQAQKIIRETFESPFDKGAFTQFTKNLLNRIDDAPFTYQGNYIPDAYKQYIKTLERIGKFSDGENNIDILVITLQKETSLERARTMQRNFVAWYLNGSRGGEMKDAALAAFVSPDEADWRFSLVKMDYKFEKTKTGKVKVKEEFTPARRWSFLVGANEKSHTAQSRLVNILADDEHAPTLEEIEKAFDIETVTKEFFLKYRELFLRTKEELDRVVKNDPKIKADFETKGVDTVNFAKKLLGQIVFLYFLQKKGWFGVGRDDDWGEGSKHFLRELFKKKYGGYTNFFNDILEPLFYEALRIDRSHDDDYYSRFNCKIPFLNGGLFDPIGNYDWVHADIIIPDKLFSNTEKTKEGDTGNGILDIFDRYNFTVKEDEPLEKEVAIDPELLGKSYEKFNAIRPDNYAEFKKALKSGKKGEENKFNKKFGVYYTPREIVHYMCQQSLINYLATELDGKVGKEDIEILIHLGEQVSENEATALLKEKLIAEGKQKTTKNKPLLSQSIKNNADLIDDKLAEIMICDPAVGSGAFPVGMMSETVKARNVLSVFLNDKERTTYNFKRRCIEHSLYGVDIDPGAVEIAKLRLWLSLVVDEDDIKNIKPLPNLDYRIMQGNSLISEFMGVNFDTDKDKNIANLMFKDETDVIIEQFQQKKEEFLNESNVTRKSKLKEEVENLLIEIFETKLKIQKEGYFNRLKNIENKYSLLRNQKQKHELIKQEKEKLYKESGFNLELAEKQLKDFTSGREIKPFFLWDLYFSEVFHNKGGFDVVIANPPYVGQKGNKEVFQILKKHLCWTNFYERKQDLYYYFIAQGIKILNNNAILSYIIPPYFTTAAAGKNLRKYIIENSNIYKILNLSEDIKVFESASINNLVLFLNKYNKDKKIIIEEPQKNIDAFLMNLIKYKSKFSTQELNSNEWYLFKDSNTFEISAKNTIPLGIISTISPGIQTGCDKVSNSHIESYNLKDIKKAEGIFVLTEKEKSRLDLNPKELDYVKPFYKNSDIFKWGYSKKNNNWIIVTNHIQNINNYPKLKKHLIKYKPILDNRYRNFALKNADRDGKWWYLYGYRPNTNFDNEKIILPYRSIENTFAYSNKPFYSSIDVFYINIIQKEYDVRFVNSILCSRLINYWLKNNCKKKGSVLELYQKPLSLIPIKIVSKECQKPCIKIVDKILSLTQSNDYLQNSQKQAKVRALEREIDQLVYDLYALTEDEIKIIENS